MIAIARTLLFFLLIGLLILIIYKYLLFQISGKSYLVEGDEEKDGMQGGW